MHEEYICEVQTSWEENISIEKLILLEKRLQHRQAQRVKVALPAIRFQCILVCINPLVLEVGEAVYFSNTGVIPGNVKGVVKTIIKHPTAGFKIATPSSKGPSTT